MENSSLNFPKFPVMDGMSFLFLNYSLEKRATLLGIYLNISSEVSVPFDFSSQNLWIYLYFSWKLSLPFVTHLKLFYIFCWVESTPVHLYIVTLYVTEIKIVFYGMDYFPNNHLSKSLDDFFLGYVPYKHSILCGCSTYTINISCKLSKLKSVFPLYLQHIEIRY